MMHLRELASGRIEHPFGHRRPVESTASSVAEDQDNLIA